MQIRDVSDHGLAFVSESSDRFKQGEEIDSFFYVNPALRIPLKLVVRRITTEDEPTIGAELMSGDKTNEAGIKAYFSFLHLLDELAAFV